jgi:hypothetical protein
MAVTAMELDSQYAALGTLDRLARPQEDVGPPSRKRLHARARDEGFSPLRRSKGPGVSADSIPDDEPATNNDEMRPDVSGFQFIKHFAWKAIASLSSDSKNALLISLRDMMIAEHGSTPADGAVLSIKLGTCCSGSELFLSGFKHLTHAVRANFGIEVRFEHMWSFEIAPQKRAWIMENWSPCWVFGDLTKVDPEGMAFDYKTNSVQKVMGVHWVLAGTSCKDASRLNVHHSERLSVVTAGTFSTGSTIQGLVHLMSLLKPQKVFLENVVGLMDKAKTLKAGAGAAADKTPPPTSNFDALRDMCMTLGYDFYFHAFDARDTGLPVNRSRLYMEAAKP